MIQKLELRPLCSLILDKTINDPDKYQSGLTKIFFRAGMLAALESLRSEKLNALVTIVQKNMRRRMAVKKYQELRSATIKIQTWWRGILARRLVESIRRDVAAKRIQAGVRRFLQRSKFLQVRQAIIAVQSREFWRLQRRRLADPWHTQVFVVHRLGERTGSGGHYTQLCSCNPCSAECMLLVPLVLFSVLMGVIQAVPPFKSI